MDNNLNRTTWMSARLELPLLLSREMVRSSLYRMDLRVIMIISIFKIKNCLNSSKKASKLVNTSPMTWWKVFTMASAASKAMPCGCSIKRGTISQRCLSQCQRATTVKDTSRSCRQRTRSEAGMPIWNHSCRRRDSLGQSSQCSNEMEDMREQ